MHGPEAESLGGGAGSVARGTERALDIFDEGTHVVVLPGATVPIGAEAAASVARCWGGGRATGVEAEPGWSALRTAFAELPFVTARLVDMVEVFHLLTDAQRIGVRIASLRAPMCPALHVDRVELRLVCALHGPGTEYIGARDVDRSALRQRGGPQREALERHPSLLRASAGDWVLLKGEAWPGNAGRGAIHRSPASGGGELRVVVTLDVLG
jgi:hypothetical protein